LVESTETTITLTVTTTGTIGGTDVSGTQTISYTSE
jgi:hypothetical protein